MWCVSAGLGLPPESLARVQHEQSDGLRTPPQRSRSGARGEDGPTATLCTQSRPPPALRAPGLSDAPASAQRPCPGPWHTATRPPGIAARPPQRPSNLERRHSWRERSVDVEAILVPIHSHQPHPRPMHRHRPRPRPRPIRPIHHAHHPHVLRPRLCHAPRVSCSVSSRAARCQSRVVSAARCRLELLDVSRVVRSVSVAACFAQSPRREESRVIASSVVSRRVTRRLSPRREESRVIASSVVSRRLSSVLHRPAARCQSRREESRVISSSVVSRRLSPRREESRVIASSVVPRRLSSVVRRPAARCQSRRVLCGNPLSSPPAPTPSSACLLSLSLSPRFSVGLCARRQSRPFFLFRFDG